ncbi:VOC family protein [Pimelobacter simplex]
MSRFTLALPIADRHRAATFYRETLGLELVGTPADDGHAWQITAAAAS